MDLELEKKQDNKKKKLTSNQIMLILIIVGLIFIVFFIMNIDDNSSDNIIERKIKDSTPQNNVQTINKFDENKIKELTKEKVEVKQLEEEQKEKEKYEKMKLDYESEIQRLKQENLLLLKKIKDSTPQENKTQEIQENKSKMKSMLNKMRNDIEIIDYYFNYKNLNYYIGDSFENLKIIDINSNSIRFKSNKENWEYTLRKYR